MRVPVEHWGCARAGQNWLIIRTNGTLAPCFPIYNDNNANYDGGTVGQHNSMSNNSTRGNEKGAASQCVFLYTGYNFCLLLLKNAAPRVSAWGSSSEWLQYA